MSRENTANNILDNEVLTAQEVATYLRVSRVTVWRWCQQGTIPAYRVGRNWRIHRQDLLEMVGRPQPPNSGLPPATHSATDPPTVPEVPLAVLEER